MTRNLSFTFNVCCQREKNAADLIMKWLTTNFQKDDLRQIYDSEKKWADEPYINKCPVAADRAWNETYALQKICGTTVMKSVRSQGHWNCFPF